MIEAPTIRRSGCRVEHHADGSRTIHLDDQAVAMLKQLRESFRKKFGRDPGPHDPVFFDPDADVPRQMDPEKLHRTMADAARRAGVPADQAYATAKTGLVLVDGVNDHLVTDEARQEWDEAIDEHRRMS
jgi:hypothetical protein